MDDARRPVISNKPVEIDKLITREKNAIRASLTKVNQYNLLRKDPPQKLIDQLQKHTDQIAYLTRARIKNLSQISEKEIKTTLGYMEEISKVPYINEDRREEKNNELFHALASRQKERLAWQMKKLETNPHPLWQKAAMESLTNLSLLADERPELQAYIEEQTANVQNIPQEYARRRKEKFIDPEEERLAVEAQESDPSKSYKRIQQNPADEIFVREQNRGIADRGI